MSVEPFGIACGTDTNQLQIVREQQEFTYFIIPPKTHPSFRTYVATSAPDLGVVQLMALGTMFSDDEFGHLIKAEFDKVSRQLGQRYGQVPLNDFLDEGSIWDEPRDWANSIEKNERTYCRIWNNKTSKLLPAEISKIFLTVSALDNELYIVLTYTFLNYEQYSKMLDDRESEAF